MKNVYTEDIKNIKKHRTAAKAKLKAMAAAGLGLGTIREYEKNLRIVQACNRKLTTLYQGNRAVYKAMTETK